MFSRHFSQTQTIFLQTNQFKFSMKNYYPRDIVVFLMTIIGLTLLPSTSFAFGKYEAKNSAECYAQLPAEKITTQRQLQAERLLCKQIDQVRQNTRMSLASVRVSRAINAMKAGIAVPLQLQKEIYADQLAMRHYEMEDYLAAYQQDFAKFVHLAVRYDANTSRLASNWEQQANRCEEFSQRITAFKKDHTEALSALLAAKKSGSATSSWQTFEQSRKRAQQLIQSEQQAANANNCLHQDPAAESIETTSNNTPGTVTRNTNDESFEAGPPIGNMQTIGNYLWRAQGSTATLFSNQSILVYGSGLQIENWDTNEVQIKQLKAVLAQGDSYSGKNIPALWNPLKQGWHQLPAAPECLSNRRSLHSVNEISGHQVLITGGICNQSSEQQVSTQVKLIKSLSIFDLATKQWQKAPSLDQARVYHSSNVLNDGGVIIIGGADFVGDANNPNLIALNSVEYFAKKGVNAEIKALAPLAQARAKHASSVSADGTVFVSGGFDSNNNAIASVEVWNPKTQTWRMIAPLKTARYSHTSSLLKDGRIMVIGGWGSDHQPLTSVEIWNPIDGTWSEGPDFPVSLHGHSAAVLNSGTLIVSGGAWLEPMGQELPWAWMWNTTANEWNIIAQAIPTVRSNLSTDFHISATPEGGAILLSKQGIFKWQTQENTSANKIPKWRAQPIIAKLTDGRSLWIGQAADNLGSRPKIALLFNRKDQTWTDAGHLHRIDWDNTAAIELPSRQVMYVGIRADVLQCEIWTPDTTLWSDCGIGKSEYVSDVPLELGLLPDGRVFAIANLHETFVFDQKNKTWNTWRTAWNRMSLPYGVALRSEQAFFQLYDEETGIWLDANNAGARFWMHSRKGDGIRLLWDHSKSSWAYVMSSTTHIGKDAQFLPDGCAISTQPLAIFNPATGKAMPLTGPGAARIPPFGTMQVFDDGSLIVVKETTDERDLGSTFFFGKASCAGLADDATGASYFFGPLLADTAPIEPVAQAQPTTSIQEKTGGFVGFFKDLWSQHIQALFPQYLWLILLLSAILLITLLAKKTRLGQVKVKSSRSFRIIIYSIVVIFAVSNITKRLRAPTDDIFYTCDQDPKACLDPQSGLLKSTGTEPSKIPCRMVGIWSYRKNTIQRRIELKEDGSYTMEAVQGSQEDGKLHTGYWALQGKTMAWRHTQSDTDIELNLIQFESDTQFSLTEQDQAVIPFELIKKSESTRCTQ
jgi:hypothetical protein